MRRKHRGLLFGLMAVFLLLFLLANINLRQLSLRTDNWGEYVLIGIFFALLYQFELIVERDYWKAGLKAAITDPLSRLYTSSHFFKSLECELDRTQRHGNPLSILLLDIDYFTRYNDEKGHKAGDAVLCKLGDIIRQSTRRYDRAFRMGGDEFALILPETYKKQAKVIAERIQTGLMKSDEGAVTVSIGLGSYAKGDTVDRLFKKGQTSLEAAQRAGGDCIRGYQNRELMY